MGFWRSFQPIGHVFLAALWAVASFASPTPSFSAGASDALTNDLAFFAGIADRTSGTRGSAQAADFIVKRMEEAGLKDVGTQRFQAPVPEVLSASLEADGETLDVYPWGPNVVYLSMTPKEGLGGRLVYVGDGALERFDGKPVQGNIVLMDMDSRENWMNAPLLGASALVFLGDKDTNSGGFKEKNIPTPIAFPRFWVPAETGLKLKRLAEGEAGQAVLRCRTRWQNKTLENILGFLPGRHPKLKNELIVLDAFYDSTSHILGLAPGADEALSISMLLHVARELVKNPPERSVLFLATGGNSQSLAGMRHFIWAITTRKKLLRKEGKDLEDKKRIIDRDLDLLQQEVDPLELKDPADQSRILRLLVEKAKDKADILTRESQYRRLLGSEGPDGEFEEARPYRLLSWTTTLDSLQPSQKPLATQLLREVAPDLKARQRDVKLRLQAAKSTNRVRNLVDEYNPVLFLSLHLSSNSPYLGIVELGDTYPVRENVRRMVRASRLSTLLHQTGVQEEKALGLPSMIKDTSMGNDDEGAGKCIAHPCLCCDVAAIAGLPAVSLSTLEDNRSWWSTPNDTLDRVNMENVGKMATLLPGVLGRLFSNPSLHTGSEGGIRGLASLEGRAMFVRQGELFPDQPAPGTIVSVMQKNTIFRGMVHEDGSFFIPGLANSRVALEKLIVEPYGLDPETGRISQAADKKQTGKINYRVKVKTDLATISLVMFRCRQTDIVPIFNPKTLGYLTKVELLDASTETTPLKHWYSRIDGRNTMAISVLLEKGTRFKLILSESLLSKDFFLLNGSPRNPNGSGFLIGDPPMLPLAPFQVAKDLHQLVGGRLTNLFEHGIVNRHLESLYESSSRELTQAEEQLTIKQFSKARQFIGSALAKFIDVYDEIERNQRDVLAGVMFFIALFVPFAHCMERYLFAFRGIYQQLTAFFVILLMTIFTIRALHPAFQLTYSPMVVIIAFFIVGLSLSVSWIIFMRFEEQMAQSENRAAHLQTPEASKWQSFGAGFAIGVSNLNRRKLRTGLTCLTLIILTFTVMSFTNVKSLHRTMRTLIAEGNPYEGILLRHQFRMALTLLPLDDMENRFRDQAVIWPKGWIEPSRTSDRGLAGVYTDRGSVQLEGVLGLGAGAPTYFRDIITHGRWFEHGEANAILLPVSVARSLGLDPAKDLNAPVQLMGDAYRVVGFFDGQILQSRRDLDQELITPAYEEKGQGEELTEAEIEAMQSGEEIIPQIQKFRNANANLTAILPFNRVLEYGGRLRAVSIIPTSRDMNPLDAADQLSTWLGFPLFVGKDGTWYHSASTTLRYQGVANLAIPILIVVFITLNTMIGHVHERQREIGTYTSVGLAPTHVGFLFIVEALSLAVISTVIGYILAQLSAKTLGNTTLFSELTFNYSSLASVACMFLVFSVVFLAALYPARMAARIAMPDVERSWTLPEPEADIIDMTLPFLFKYEEEKGIMGFLNAYYVSHQDVAQETFIADQTEMNLENPELCECRLPGPLCILLRTNLWLEPFDFGIKQRIHLHCCPSPDNPGYLEIAIRMIRLSGERSAWVRANRNFIKALRKQLLLWRFLDAKAKLHYVGLVPFEYEGQMEGAFS